MGAFPENWFWGTTKTSFYVYITSNFFVGSFHIDFAAMYIYLLVCLAYKQVLNVLETMALWWWMAGISK